MRRQGLAGKRFRRSRGRGHAGAPGTEARVSFDYHEPTSVREAVELGARFGADGRFLAGGTDLLVQIRRGQLVPRHLLSCIACRDSTPSRSTGRQARRARHPSTAGADVRRFRGALEALIEGAQVVGGHQIRNVATVGGNVVNASPAADVVPVLLALDAAVTLQSSRR